MDNTTDSIQEQTKLLLDLAVQERIEGFRTHFPTGFDERLERCVEPAMLRLFLMAGDPTGPTWDRESINAISVLITLTCCVLAGEEFTEVSVMSRFVGYTERNQIEVSIAHAFMKSKAFMRLTNGHPIRLDKAAFGDYDRPRVASSIKANMNLQLGIKTILATAAYWNGASQEQVIQICERALVIRWALIFGGFIEEALEEIK